jgi:hypothetical protein
VPGENLKRAIKAIKLSLPVRLYNSIEIFRLSIGKGDSYG